MKKTLKFFSLAALTIAVAAMIGCSKDEELANNDKVVTSTATLTLDNGGEAAKALTDAGVKTFAAGEQIAVVYENTSSTMVKAVVTLTAGDITNSGKTANISVTMTNPESNGALRIIYPAAMAGTDDVDYSNLANQDGTLTTLAANLDLGYYSGTLDGENLPASPALSNPLAICKFSIKNSDGSSDLTSDITGLCIDDGVNVYWIDRAAAAGPIYVAMQPVGSSQYINFYATDGTNKYEKEVSGKTLAAGNLYTLGIKSTQLQAGATFGRYNFGSSTYRHFSEGNLRYVSGTWSFFENQYGLFDTYSADAWDKFGWSTSSTTYGMSTSQDYSDYSGDFVDWGNNVAGSWSTPSTTQWQGVFANQSYGSATIDLGGGSEVHGIVLIPEHSSLSIVTGQSAWNDNTYTAAQWAKMEAAGAVFLPAAGGRYGTGVNGVGYSGYYWSSTAIYAYYAWCVVFYEEGVYPDGNGYDRNYGESVRLVCE